MPRLQRFNIKAMLANPDLRRKLIVEGTRAAQAREGVDVSTKEAENSYYVVTEAERAAFFALVPFRTEAGDSDGRHAEFVECLNELARPSRIDLSLRDFTVIDGSPLAFDKLGLISQIFRDNTAFDSAAASIEQGVALMNVARYVRHFWEIDSRRIAKGPNDRSSHRPWLRLSKGGDYCRFYYDFDLVVYGQSDWEDMKAEINQRYPYLKGKTNMLIHEENRYFEAGLTWPRRTQRGFNVRYLPQGHVFSDKGPTIFLKKNADTFAALAVLNSSLAEFLLKALVSFGSWEITGVRRLAFPETKVLSKSDIGNFANRIYVCKAQWDTGNETSTRFDLPWVLQNTVKNEPATLSGALDAVLLVEADFDSEVKSSFYELNDTAYRLYGVKEALRSKIEAAIGPRPPEIVWPQMDGKTIEQKRLEHVNRLLTYSMKRIVEADNDGLVCLQAVAQERPMLDRLREELHRSFPQQDPSALETEVVNELKKKVKGCRRAETLNEWLNDAFFEIHANLYQQRPLLWHLASSQTRSVPAFSVVVHAHKFDGDALAKLRSVHIRDRLTTLRREAGQARHDNREEDRLELLAAIEEVEAFDAKLKLLQEGAHTGPEGGDRDYRILTPWKAESDRPQGWNPDLDDGIKVNIAPLARTGLLRIKGRFGEKDVED